MGLYHIAKGITNDLFVNFKNIFNLINMIKENVCDIRIEMCSPVFFEDCYGFFTGKTFLIMTA